MAKGQSSQRTIGANRPPRVQIEYETETYGSEQKTELPFVMGVLADLSGQPKEALAPLAQREFLEFDMENFNSRMKKIAPRVQFTVPNTLTSEGNLAIDMTFESMDDFSPGAIARKVGPLNKLLEVRQQLDSLIVSLDGKASAEETLEKILGNKELMRLLAAQPATDSSTKSD